MATTLHILVGNHNAIDWLFLFNYMRTNPTHSYIESNGQATYMRTHPNVPFPPTLALPHLA